MQVRQWSVYKKSCFNLTTLMFPKLQSFVFVNEFLTFWCTATGLQSRRYYWLTLTLVYNYTNQTNILFLNLTQNQNFDHDEHSW